MKENIEFSLKENDSIIEEEKLKYVTGGTNEDCIGFVNAGAMPTYSCDRCPLGKQCTNIHNH